MKRCATILKMPEISTTRVSPPEVKKLLSLSEGHFMDLKSIRIAPGKLTKAISAFANAEGGELFIGVEDSPRKWEGFETEEDANAHLQVFEELFPLGADFDYQFLEADGENGLIVKATVSKTRDLVEAGDGKVYVRRGAQSLPVPEGDRLEALKRDKGLTSFETEPVNCPADAVTNSERIIGFLLEVVPSAEPRAWLEKQLILLGGKPTVAALVLFADEPQAALPKRCGIKIYRYKTSDAEGTRETLEFDPISIEGCAYAQIKQAVASTTEIVQSVKVRTPVGLVDAQYPFEALHEVITNAVIHRDYSITDDIHIRIFDNRIEVLSPGTLSGHVTVQNILEERFARNPVIVRLINKFPDPPNKDVGEGLNTAFNSMRAMKLKEPVIEQQGGYVKVSLRHESLATPEEAVLIFLKSNDTIANREARTVAYIESENKMKRVLQGMVSKGLLESVPGRTRYNAAYQLTDDGRKMANDLE